MDINTATDKCEDHGCDLLAVNTFCVAVALLYTLMTSTSISILFPSSILLSHPHSYHLHYYHHPYRHSYHYSIFSPRAREVQGGSIPQQVY